MKEVKIKFVDWPYQINDDCTFLNILKSKYLVTLSNQPDYIFYSDFGKEHLNYDCIRIYYTPENLVPDFNICDYAIGFHYIDFEDRYLRFPIYGLFKYKMDYEKALKKHIVNDEEIKLKLNFCNFIYSNANADKIRSDFFSYLNQYKFIDSGGGYINNIGYSVIDKYKFQKQYKFSIAFENSSMSGYTTEKIVQAFAAQTIPIYWGDPKIDMFFNEKAFINLQKYKSFKDVLDRIIEIDNNPLIFEEIIKEPMLKNIDLEYGELENFLFNIFDGGSNNYRRSNTLRGKWYQDYHKDIAKIYMFRNKLKFIVSKFKISVRLFKKND